MKKRILKILGYILIFIIVLLAIIALALRTSAVQNYISNKVMTSLSERYNAEWRIDNIKIDFMDEVIIDGILFKDQQGDTLLAADRLMVDIGLVNLLAREVRLDEVVLDGVISHIYNHEGGMNFDFLLPDSAMPTNEEEESKPWDISIGDVILNKSKVRLDQEEQTINVDLPSLKLAFRKTDFEAKAIALSQIEISEMSVTVYNDSKVVRERKPFSMPDIGWNITVDRAAIYKTFASLTTEAKSDKIRVESLAIDDFILINDSLSMHLDVEELRFNDLPKVSEINGMLTLQGEALVLGDLLVTTERDRISSVYTTINLNRFSINSDQLDLRINHNSLADFRSFLPQKLQLKQGADLTIQSSQLTYRGENIQADDLKLSYGNLLAVDGNFAAILSRNNLSYIKSNINRVEVDIQSAAKLWQGFSIPDSLRRYRKLSLAGNVEGSLDYLEVRDFALELDDVVDFKGRGNISNIGNSKELQFDLHIDRLAVVTKDLPIKTNESLALDSLGTVIFSGELAGSLDNLDIEGEMMSDLGSLDADLQLSFPSDINKLTYKGTLALDQFDVGTLLQNDKLDIISMKLNLDGRGLDLESMNSSLNGVINDFAYNGYTYAEINLDAKISDKLIEGKVNINDTNLKLDYQGTFQLDSSSTVMQFIAKIDTINLQALGFVDSLLTVSGVVDSEIRLPLRIDEQGSVMIYDLILSNGVDRFSEDTMSILARKSVDSTVVSLKADFADIMMSGDFGIRDLPASINDLVNYYVDLDTAFVHYDGGSRFLNVRGDINTLLPINIVMPDLLLQAGTITVNTTLDFEDQSIDGKIKADSLFVSSFFSEEIALNISSENRNILADIEGVNNKIAGTDIPILRISNAFEERKFSSTFEAKDEDKLPRLRFTLDADFADGLTQFSLSDSLILNSKDWLANPNNLIKVYDGKVVVQDFELTDNNEFLIINSTGIDGNGLNMEFKNFNIGQFATLLTSKPSKLSGNIDGSIDLMDINKEVYYLVNLEIEDIVYDSTVVGMLTIDAQDDPVTGILTTTVNLTGPTDNVSGGGTYNTKTTELDFDLDVQSFPLMLIDPFVSTIMNDSKGTIQGQISLEGTASQPIVNGEVTLNDVVTTIVANNTRYGLDQQTITFDNSSIDIGILDIYDTRNNVATVTGKIYHSYLQDMELDMSLKTDKFTFLNTKAKDNPVFYGKMVLNADVDITGPIDLLDVDVIAQTLDSTEVNISPFSAELFLLEEEFITYGKPSDFEDLSNDHLLRLARKFPFKVNILLDAKQNALMNFVVDPVTGDRIEARGNGNLRIKLNPDGQQEIFGTYTISDGSYAFSYGDFVSKDFKVKPGGTVRFNGNPLTAILDIDAIYSVYTTTYELIKNEISADDNEVAAAQRRTDVDVYLSLKGTLDKPLIKLDIKVPSLESANLTSSIDRKLNELRNNPNELNNQVFGLLIFNSFILSDNAASGFGNLGSNIALSSVSSLISNQLNKLADKVVRGVDVDINVNSYDSEYANSGAGGNVTEVGLKVSKQLFNDRLSISAGGNFDLSDQSSSSQSYSSLIGDFVLEYKLTESGRYRVRVFSKTDYDRLLNENTNKNGVSIFFNRSFDSKLDDK